MQNEGSLFGVNDMPVKPVGSCKKWKVWTIIFAVLFVGASVFACVLALKKDSGTVANNGGGGTSETETPDEDGIVWRQYTTFGGFAFDYPEGWEIETERRVDIDSNCPSLRDFVTITSPSGVVIDYQELTTSCGYGGGGANPLYRVTENVASSTGVSGVDVMKVSDFVFVPNDEFAEDGSHTGSPSPVGRTFLELRQGGINDTYVFHSFLRLPASLNFYRGNNPEIAEKMAVTFVAENAQDFTEEELDIAVRILASFRKFE